MAVAAVKALEHRQSTGMDVDAVMMGKAREAVAQTKALLASQDVKSLEPVAEAPKRPRRKAKGRGGVASSRKPRGLPEEFEMVTYSGGKIVKPIVDLDTLR